MEAEEVDSVGTHDGSDVEWCISSPWDIGGLGLEISLYCVSSYWSMGPQSNSNPKAGSVNNLVFL